MRRPVPTTVLAAALAVSALAGCSAGVKHVATKASGTTTTSSTVKGHRTTTTTHQGSSTTTSGSGSSGGTGSSGGSGGGGGGGGDSSGGSGVGGAAGGGGTGATTTAAPTGPAQLTSFSVTDGPHCATTSGSSTVKLSWTSKGAAEAWLLPGSTAGALVGADAKTTTPNYGPLPANGSMSITFDCGNDANYALLEVYNSTSHNGTVLQIPINTDMVN